MSGEDPDHFILYHDWDAFCCIKVRFCLAELGLGWDSRIVDLQAMQQLTPEYLATNPNGVVPTLLHGGRSIYESSIINEYLNDVAAQSSLLPHDAASRAIARFWVKFEDDVLHPSVKGPTYQMMLRQSFAKMPRAIIEERIALAPTPQKAEFLRKSVLGGDADPNQVHTARESFKRAIDKMEARLREAEWFGGDTFSLADIAIAPFIDRLEELKYGGLWNDKPELSRWIERIKSRSAYQTAIPSAAQRLPSPQ